jgi:putative IMPACT (imprinted ancient) family translation regulator
MHNNNNNMNGVASIDSNTKRQFLQGLQDEYVEGTCVGIYWAECCREFLLQAAAVKNDEDCDSGGRQLPISSEDASVNNNNNNTNNLDSTDQEKMITFLPSTTRFHQPIRHFSSSIISNPIYQCKVHRTSPFHPPNSGASECLIAHVAKVTCMEHVLWTLGQLLLCDKKVGKASHNMFAYRFYTSSNENAGESGGGGGGSGGRSTRVLVSDNDDDGEKGSGKKLSALLELCHVENVLVVVSRWFGGELLGAARFKWIASVAKDGLVQAGLV